MEVKKLRISEAAAILGVTAQTLRNWEKSGRLVPQRSPGGQRYYVLSEIQRLAEDLPRMAWAWGSSSQPPNIPDEYYCEQSDRFMSRLGKMGVELKQALGAKVDDLTSLLMLVAGEIGDNSFAHNMGNWPDVPGIFFSYDIKKRVIVLADRGQGVRMTLQQVRPAIASDVEALRVAFTEIISGRNPEMRGNGLKVVRSIAESNQIGLSFNSGMAQVIIQPKGKMRVAMNDRNVRGVIAVINF